MDRPETTQPLPGAHALGLYAHATLGLLHDQEEAAVATFVRQLALLADIDLVLVYTHHDETADPELVGAWGLPDGVESAQLLANALDLGWNYTHPSEILAEIARLTPTFTGVSWERLEREGSLQWPVNEKFPDGAPIMHVDGFVRGKGKFVVTEYVPTDERTGPRFPLLLTTGRILSQYNVGAQTRRTANVVWHEEDVLEMHPTDAENRGLKDGDWTRLASRTGETTLRLTVTDRVAPGVVYTTFHHPTTQANVVTTDFSDWATNCPEYKVTAVQVSPSNGPSEWQEEYNSQAERSRRIAQVEPAE